MFYKRLTEKESLNPCHIKCDAFSWIGTLCNHNLSSIDIQWICDFCPFSKYLQRLNELENEIENRYDDGK